MSVYKNGHKQHAIVDDGFPSTLLLLLIVALFISRPKQTTRSRAFKKAIVSIISHLLFMVLLLVFIAFSLAYALLLKGIHGLYKNKVEIASIHSSFRDTTKENAIHDTAKENAIHETAPMSPQDIALWEAYHPHQAIPFPGNAAVVRQDPECSAVSSSAQSSVDNTVLTTRNRPVTHTSDDTVAKLPESTPPCSSHWVSSIRKDLASDWAIRETTLIAIKDTTKDTIKDETTLVTAVPQVASPAALAVSVLSSATLVSSMSSNASTLVDTHTSSGTSELQVLKTGNMRPLPARSLSTVGPSSAAPVAFRPSKIGPVGAAAAVSFFSGLYSAGTQSGATATPTTTSTGQVTQGTASPTGGPRIQHAPWSLATPPGQLMTQGFANPGGDQSSTGPSAVVPKFSLDKILPHLPFTSTHSTKVKIASESGSLLTPTPAAGVSTSGMDSDGTKGSICNSRATTAISQVHSIRNAKNQITATKDKNQKTNTEDSVKVMELGASSSIKKSHKFTFDINALAVAAQVARLCLFTIKAIAQAIIWTDTEERPQGTVPATETPSSSSSNANTSVLKPSSVCGPMTSTSNEYPIHETYQRHFMNHRPLAPPTVSPSIAIATFPVSSSPLITTLAGTQDSPLKPVLPSPATLSTATSHTMTGTTTVSNITSTVLPGQGFAPSLGGLRSYTANSPSAITNALSATKGSVFSRGVQRDAGPLAVVPIHSFFQRSDKIEMNPLNNVINKENSPVKNAAKKKSPIENVVNKSGPIEKANTKKETPLNNVAKKNAPLENAVKKNDPAESADKKKAAVENMDNKKKAPIENVAKKSPASTMAATATGSGQAATAAPARQSFTIPTPPPPTAAQVAMQKARMDAQTAASVAFWVRQNTFPPVTPPRKKPFIPRGRFPFFRTSKGKMNEDLTDIDEKRSMPPTNMDAARPSKRTKIERPIKDTPMPDARAKRPLWSARTSSCQCRRCHKH